MRRWPVSTEAMWEQLRAGAGGFKLHEDWGTTPSAIDACLRVADASGVQVNIQAPFPRVEAYILGENDLYFFYGGQEDDAMPPPICRHNCACCARFYRRAACLRKAMNALGWKFPPRTGRAGGTI